MTPHPQQHDEVCAEEDFCKGCGNFDGFYNSCKLAQYKTLIQGKSVWVAPRTNGTRWLLKSVGCASDTRSHPHTPTAPDIKSSFRDEDMAFKDSIIEQQGIHIKALNAKMAEMLEECTATIRNQTLKEVYDFSNMSFRTGFTEIVSIKVNDEFVAYGYPGYELILLNKSLRHQSTEAPK